MISMRQGSSALLVTLSLLAVLPSAAQAQARRDAAAPVAAPAGAANVMPQTADVSGFRSAKFGMSENDVKNAIAKDFNAKGDAIRTDTNPSEQTKVLTIKAADVLPGGGMAEVSYVFGFKSKTLIQVGIAWSKASDDKMTPEQLFSNANVLRTHFLAAGYKPDTIAANMPINGGVLMFRGSDAKDRTTMLILQGTFTQGEKDQRILTPTGLALFYVADAKSPDVYRLPAGSF
jgi:hypothetical protein